MVIGELIAVGGTIAGTLLGTGLQYWNSRKSAEEASERLFEERALESKFDRIENLHDSLDNCLSEFREVTFQGPDGVEDYSERVRKPYDEFIDAADKARIYLSPEEREVIEETREEFNSSRTFLRTMAESMDDDWPDRRVAHKYEKSPDELTEAAEPVFEIVRKKLDPEYERDE